MPQPLEAKSYLVCVRLSLCLAKPVRPRESISKRDAF